MHITFLTAGGDRGAVAGDGRVLLHWSRNCSCWYRARPACDDDASPAMVSTGNLFDRGGRHFDATMSRRRTRLSHGNRNERCSVSHNETVFCALATCQLLVCLFCRAMSKTSIPLKNLRGTLLLLIVAFHAFSAYIVSQPALAPAFDQPPYDWRIFPIVDNERWLGFDLFCAFQFLYLMQFMFFLSGLFVWSSLQRKSWREFLVHRFARLGVPFVIGVYALMPLTFYPVYRVTAIDPSWSAFWAHWMALPTNPTGPMWFLWCLIVLDVVGVVIYQLAPHTKQYVGPLLADAMTRPGMLFAALLCVSALAYLPLSAIYSPWG